MIKVVVELNARSYVSSITIVCDMPLIACTKYISRLPSRCMPVEHAMIVVGNKPV